MNAEEDAREARPGRRGRGVSRGSSERPIHGPRKGRDRCATFMTARFTWDAAKSRSNLAKHGVSFEEAVTVFMDRLALLIEDAVDPERTILLGTSDRHRLILVVHAEVDEETI